MYLQMFVDGEWDFRNENDVRAAGDAGVEGDPSAVASHDFDHHDAVMRFGRGVNLVDGVGRGVQRGVESEGKFGGGEIVVDGLGHADDLQPF